MIWTPRPLETYLNDQKYGSVFLYVHLIYFWNLGNRFSQLQSSWHKFKTWIVSIYVDMPLSFQYTILGHNLDVWLVKIYGVFIVAVLTARVLLYNVNIIFRGMLLPIWEKYLTYGKSLCMTPYAIVECLLTTDLESVIVWLAGEGQCWCMANTSPRKCQNSLILYIKFSFSRTFASFKGLLIIM